MPWYETQPVNERMQFVAALKRGEVTMVEACRRFGISRKTGYEIWNRFQEDGIEGLQDRSRAPRTQPHRTPVAIEAAILRKRKEHPTWGSKKLLTAVQREDPETPWPARSTVDSLLKRAGVVRPRGARRRPTSPTSPPVIEAREPNDVWSMDYKGWFRVGDGTRCDPLTVNDVATRTSLRCVALVQPKLEDVQRHLEAAFWEFGLPGAILSDNGPPFASRGLGGLSRLSVWMLRLGVQPVFIQPGKPHQNGRHERFHDTLRRETADPPAQTIPKQQRAFDDFRVVYNEERPHEALGMRVPAELYDFSPRAMHSKLEDHVYPGGWEQRRVRRDGSVKWDGGYVFLGEALRHEVVGFQRIDDGLHHVFLGPRRLGALDERTNTVVPLAIDVDAGAVTDEAGHEEGD